ncbi:ATP-binding protein [Clostridium butyricum]|uniref:ATP-binding protein n=1 Tax=Clostridium butyricum TaxID=1492 RepID=UPI00290F16E1|nr:ATP-binding protein [Clostridium butyricum]MDU5104193.1 ATP-binding protein [Clostridium butyricum]
MINEELTRIVERCKAKAIPRNYKCENCRDTGYEIVKQINAQPIIRECLCTKKERLRQQWVNNGFNVLCSNLTLNKFDSERNKVSKKIKSMAIEYIKNFIVIQFQNNNSIAFLGEPGSGKTHICTAIALELLKQGLNTIYFPYRDCMDEMIDLRVNDNNKFKNKLSKYQKSRILFIDDALKGGYTDAEIKLLFKIINYRYINRLPIILSSEYLSSDLLNIDKGVFSRVVEIAKDRILDIYGEEYNQRIY